MLKSAVHDSVSM